MHERACAAPFAGDLLCAHIFRRTTALPQAPQAGMFTEAAFKWHLISIILL